MSDVSALRAQAARCREVAKEYHPRVARPLYQKALELDREAAAVERGGRERRRPLSPGNAAQYAARLFGKRC